MARLLWWVCLLVCGVARAGVLVVELDGAIGPASADLVARGLAEAERRGSGAVVLRIDTPGGLDRSMRDIVREVLASKVPVIGFVAPGGARAASAGTYILYACHVAAMAPATNLGAATPVRIGGVPGAPEPAKPPQGQPPSKPGEPPKSEPTKPEQPGDAMERKLLNDARAYLRSLAQLRGRNVEWAEQAVSEGASLSAEEALKQNVIDLIAADVPELLAKLDGRTVKLAGGERPLATRDQALETFDPGWRTRLLAVITTPEVAYILMLIGMYGIIFELANPGSVLPGVIGGICLLLALFAFQVLPVNYAGLGLILLGMLFIAAEAFVPSYGALGLGGLVAFVAGSLLLWEDEGYSIPLGLVGGVALAGAVCFGGLAFLVARNRRRPVVSGREALLGAPGVALEDLAAGEGWVRVMGEEWRARGEGPVARGDRVRVVGRDGLVLQVRREQEGAP